jgi:hypothetical protein
MTTCSSGLVGRRWTGRSPTVLGPSSKGVNGKGLKGLDLAARRDAAAVTTLGVGAPGSHDQHDRERGGNHG